MQAIFRNTEQAVWFSFTIQAFEPGCESQMAKVLRRHLEELGEAAGYRSSIDFDGLNALEVRGQAAMVRLAVEALLPGPESWAVKSRYGLTNISRAENGKVHISFSPQRILAMNALTDYLYLSFDGMSKEALFYLVARAAGENDAIRPSFRDIAEKTGANHETLRRRFKDVSHRVRTMVDSAFFRLEPIFKKEGLVP